MSEYQKGLFIVFEGIDGSGTSTQVLELIKKIEELDKYQDVLRTHEPWRNREIKKKLERDQDAYSDPGKMADLYIDDRTDHSYELIKPALDGGTFVICSRYKMSTCAFQQSQGLSLDTLLSMHKYRGILRPDLTFFLDVEREIAVNRTRNRERKEKFEKDFGFIDKTIKNYREIVKMSENDPILFGKVVSIDANLPLEEVAGEVYQGFLPVYNEWKKPSVDYCDLQ